MAKTQHEQDPISSRTTLIALAIGGILVAALLGWALTRSVEPAAVVTSDPPVSLEAPDSAAPAAEPVTELPVTVPPATQTTPSIPPPITLGSRDGDETSVPRIAVEDLRAKLNRGEVVAVDVRDARSFELGHIPGALHVAFGNIESSIGILPRDKPIVTYCT